MTTKNEIIETFDEEGNKVSFEVIDIVRIDDLEYALLLPIGHEEDFEEGEILVMRIKKDGEDDILEVIENDEEFEKISQYIENFEEELED